jgi:hypothetical protein
MPTATTAIVRQIPDKNDDLVRHDSGGQSQSSLIDEATEEESNTDAQQLVKKKNADTMNCHRVKPLDSAQKVKVIFVLVVIMSVVGAIAIFLYIKNTEKKQFQLAFKDDANKVCISKLLSYLKCYALSEEMHTFWILSFYL